MLIYTRASETAPHFYEWLGTTGHRERTAKIEIWSIIQSAIRQIRLCLLHIEYTKQLMHPPASWAAG